MSISVKKSISIGYLKKLYISKILGSNCMDAIKIEENFHESEIISKT